MKYENKEVIVQPEILKRHTGDELIVPFALSEGTFADMESDTIYAGSPIVMAQNPTQPMVAKTQQLQANAIGILLNDVTKDNPNGALIKAFATVNVDNANDSLERYETSFKLRSPLETALPNIVFEGELLQS